MDLFSITLAPPKLTNHCFNFLTQTDRHFKNTHRVSRNGLNDSLDHNLLSSLRQKLFLPTLHPCPYLFFQLSKTSLLFSPNKGRKPQIFFIMLYSLDIEGLFDSILCLCISISAKKIAQFSPYLSSDLMPPHKNSTTTESYGIPLLQICKR